MGTDSHGDVAALGPQLRHHSVSLNILVAVREVELLEAAQLSEPFWEGPQLLAVEEVECHEAAALPDTFWERLHVTPRQAELGQGGNLAEDGVGPLVLGQSVAGFQVEVRKGWQLSESFGE